jgi:glycogen phosphorylase
LGNGRSARTAPVRIGVLPHLPVRDRASEPLWRGELVAGGASLFAPLVDALLERDPDMLLADSRSYLDCQADVSRAYEDARRWTRMSILNVARSGLFSSDRTIGEYAEEIWRVPRVPIRLLSQSEVNVRSG